jgi:hypothetical protein
MCMLEVSVSPDLTPGFHGVRSGETDTSNIHTHHRSFPGVRSGETDTSNIHIHDRSFHGVRSGETNTSNIHIHDRSSVMYVYVRSICFT